jgi:hypothetical protein
MEAYYKMNDLLALNNLIMQLNTLNGPINMIQHFDNTSSVALSKQIINIRLLLIE